MIKFHKVNPLILVRCQHFFYKLLKLLWYVYVNAFVGRKVNTARKIQFFLLNFFYHFLKRLSIIWFFSIKHFVKNNTKGPYIAFLGIVFHLDVFLWIGLFTLEILICFVFLIFWLFLFGFSIKQGQNVRRHVPESAYFGLSLKTISAGLALLVEFGEYFNEAKVRDFDGVVFEEEIFGLNN